MKLVRTNSKDPRYSGLIQLLDAEILKRDGEDFEFYNQYNSSEDINEVVICIENTAAIGCGAFKKFNNKSAEIKRMYTANEFRGKGVASQILDELTSWAREFDYHFLVLETGRKYPEAIALYQKYGFDRIANYGPYEGVEESVCFRKSL